MSKAPITPINSQVGDGYNFTLAVTPTISTPTIAPTPTAVASQLRIAEGQSMYLKHNVLFPIQIENS
jgi:hypothetical protein